MAKDRTTIIVIIIAIILLILFLLPRGTKEKDFLEVRLYDAQGNLIGSTEKLALFSTVTISGTTFYGVSYIDVTVNARNTGSFPLVLTIDSLTPTQFQQAMDNAYPGGIPQRNVGLTETGSWTTGLICVDNSICGGGQYPLLPIGTHTLAASVLGTWTGPPAGSATRQGSLDIIIEPDLQGDFVVTISSGQSATGNVNFRTTDSNYGVNSYIAFSTTCGSTLTPYGYFTGGSTTGGGCSSLMSTLNLVGVIIGGDMPGDTATENWALWSTTNPGVMYMCKSDLARTYAVYSGYDLRTPPVPIDTSPTSTGINEKNC